ncbi:hypothetical protein JYU34_008423 [Plutella xylostella]|uniref:Uncharacterized protein n=1 Tax=Plutella xylostella TaxID=51655 RepID=A0ABQ7QM57_PLUXY|nr:hypothetical protein JYU34_008423 [Plutella xylostella]
MNSEVKKSAACPSATARREAAWRARRAAGTGLKQPMGCRCWSSRRDSRTGAAAAPTPGR